MTFKPGDMIRRKDAGEIFEFLGLWELDSSIALYKDRNGENQIQKG